MALIMVIGTASVLGIITSVIAVQSISNLRQAGTERAFERSLHVADAGVDHMLFLIRQQKQEDQTDFDDYDTVDFAPPAGTPLEEERQWVLDEAEAAAGDPGRLVTTREGDWIAMRARGVRLIYSVGYVPSYDAPRKIRVVRAEYDFAPFSPTTAILTDGDLSLGGDAAVHGSGPNVHGNGNVDVSGSADVDGYVSASGECDNCEGNPNILDSDNSGGGRPRIEVPDIDPRANYSMSEYDLCPGGTVETGPNYDAAGLALDGNPAVPNPTTTPCNGSVLADNTDFRGWGKQRDDPSQGALWRYSATGTTEEYDGVYYIHQGSATISGRPGLDGFPWEVTIFAEAVSSGTDESCPGHSHTGGDIEITGGGTISFNPKGEHLGFVAGRDLKLAGNPASGNTTFTGVHAAHEQFDIRGNTGVDGAVLANDSCDTPGSPVDASAISGSAKVTYNGASVPLGSNIRTTLWLEI
jgi:hypothetical protein